MTTHADQRRAHPTVREAAYKVINGASMGTFSVRPELLQELRVALVREENAAADEAPGNAISARLEALLRAVDALLVFDTFPNHTRHQHHLLHALWQARGEFPVLESEPVITVCGVAADTYDVIRCTLPVGHEGSHAWQFERVRVGRS